MADRGRYLHCGTNVILTATVWDMWLKSGYYANRYAVIFQLSWRFLMSVQCFPSTRTWLVQ